MVWIKRNLLLVVSGLVGLSLIGFGTFLVLGGLARNKQLTDDVEATRSRANALYDANPFPSQTNIAMAKQEMESLRDAIARAHKHFTAVPVEKFDIKRFMVWRDESLSEMREAARRAGTELPAADYSFSFATQRGKTQFSPDTLPHVPEQMAEVKALCKMLFEARVNRIGNIRRARISADDKNSSNASDYTDSRVLEAVSEPAGHMVSSPYEVTFYSFSSEVADVLNRLHRSRHGFVLKAIQVEPEDSKMADGVGPALATVNLPVNQPAPTPPNRVDRFRPPPGTNRPVVPAPVAKPTASDKPVHLLKERRLKATLLVYALKPAKDK
ncbi:MAG TPA: Amuc_1100 family pilus-like protein [Verrucomicrobiae bacterium]|nr:Amuc_1100 family pilus-like protein [Verrucomicrobiae bacterium]